MDSQLIVATIVKNEAQRYWRSALGAWNEFADHIVVFDDDSDDDTADIAKQFDKVDLFTLIDGKDMWGHEAPHRAALFNYAMRKGNPGDVVLWLDADMVPLEDPRPFFKVRTVDAFCFILYDLWGPGVYREDNFWQGHLFPRIWALRVPDSFDPHDYDWSDGRGIHSGHYPPSYPAKSPAVMPQNHGLLHYGYYTIIDREQRAQRYAAVRRMLTPFEIAHAATILDKEPRLLQLPHSPRWSLRREG